MGKKIKRLISGIVILSLVSLSGCWSSHEINTLAISICLGIDKSEKGYVITQQIINPRAFSPQKSTNEPPVILYSAEGENLETTLKSLAAQSSRMLFSYHLRVVVLSEEIAKEGIKDIIDYLTRSHEYRTDFDFVIAKGLSAKDLLCVVTSIESIPGIELSDMLLHARDEWASASTMEMIELINSIVADGMNPVMPGIEVIEDATSAIASGASEQRAKTQRFQFSGLGVFRGDKLVGWLDETESKGYNYICNKVINTTGFAGDNAGVEVTYDIIHVKSDVKAILADGNPSIRVSINLEYRISQVEGDLDISKLENRALINGYPEDKIKEICSAALSAAQEKYKTDILGFGEEFHRSYPNYWKTVKDHWSEEFETLPVAIAVTAKVVTIGETTKSFFQKEDK